MTKEKQKKMPEIFIHELKNDKGEVIETRKYYTAKGLAMRLPSCRKAHMHINTVYELFLEGMPGITTISGMRLLPIAKLSKVMDWLEERNQQV